MICYIQIPQKEAFYKPNMTNTKAPDSAQVPSETAGAPLPAVSKPSEGQPSSSGGINADALRKEIADQVREELKRELRAAQSEKDRTLKDYRETKVKIDEIYAYYKKYPDDPDQARREYEVDQLLKERQSGSVVDPGRVQPRGLEERARGKLADMGVNDKAEQDGIMQDWATKNVPDGGYANDDQALIGMAEFVVDYRVAKAKRDAPASAATAIAPAGGVQTPEDLVTLAQQLSELQRGNLNDPANQAARTALLEKIRKARSQ